MTRRSLAPLLLLAAALPLTLAPRAEALAIVAVQPSAGLVATGASLTVDLVADFDTPVLGFGLDLSFDSAVLSLLAPPSIGSAWTSAFAADGDGLVGLAPPGGVVGNGVLLATLSFLALAPGTTSISLGITSGDLTEGFPLLVSGFDNAQLGGATVSVPEPGAALLVGLAAAALLAVRCFADRRHPSERG